MGQLISKFVINIWNIAIENLSRASYCVIRVVVERKGFCLLYPRWLDIRSKVSQVGQKIEVTQPLSQQPKKNNYRVVWQKC